MATNGLEEPPWCDAPAFTLGTQWRRGRRSPLVPVSAKAVSRSTAVAANRGEDGADHDGLGFGLWESPASDLVARGMDDRAGHGEKPGDGEIAAEDTLLLAALDQGLQLVKHRDVTPV